MAYRIEDIDWSEMPDGAVEFSLEDEDRFFTWYNKDGRMKYVDSGVVSPTWQADEVPVVHYKVADHHPDMQRKEWNGEGLPPVGVPVMIQCTADGAECKGTIMYLDDDVCVWRWADDTQSLWNETEDMRFKPIRSERDEWVDWASEHFCDDSATETMARVYDALKSGKLKAP